MSHTWLVIVMSNLEIKITWSDCMTGFEGLKCENKIDQCKNNLCPSDAIMCIDSITEPHCICPTVSNHCSNPKIILIA